VELVREGEEVRLSKMDLLKLPPDAEVSLEQGEVSKKLISGLLARNHLKQKDVIVGIGGQTVFIKFLEVLPVSTEKLEKTIKYEAQQQIPFPLEEVEWDAYLFGPRKKEHSSACSVLLVAVKKDQLAGRMSLIEQAGLRPSILDTSILSIYNCIRFNQDYDKDKLTAVLDIGAQSTDLLILQGDKFWMRGFAIGGDNITGALEKKFNISFAEAQRLKQGSRLDSPDIKEAVKAVLEDLQGEITRSVEYYYFQRGEASSQQPGTGRIKEILLSGGASLMQGLDKFLEQAFSCPVRGLQPFKRLRVPDEELKKKLNSESRALFSQAVGLALRGLSKSCININLLKEQLRARRLLRQRVGYSVSSVILALLILLGASTFMRQDYWDKSLRLRRLKGLLDSFCTYLPHIKELQKEKNILSLQVKGLGALAANRALWLEALSELQKMLPDDLWITEFAGTVPNKLDLQGKAVSYEAVNEFVARLKSSTLFTQVKPLSSAFIEEKALDKEKVEVVKFSINMKVAPIKKVAPIEKVVPIKVKSRE